MKKRTIMWIVSVFLLASFFVYLPSIASILFLIAGILCLPVDSVQNFLLRYVKSKPFKGLLAALLFFVGALIAPSDEITASTTPLSSPSTSYSSTTEEENVSIQLPEATIAPSPIPTSTLEPSAIPTESTFSIHFIDVGQADAALVECDGHYMLIDGGNRADSDKIYSALKSENVPKLDIVVGTHAHEDHIGGLPGAFNYTTADLTLCPVSTYDSKAFENFKKYADQKGGGITIPSFGDVYQLGSSTITIIGVNGGTSTNDTSIVLRIDYGDTSFLFTGDAERDAEQTILNSEANLSATVLKVGHHGSDTSTTYPFLREIMPQYAVISCGKDNNYGHPTEATLSRLHDADVTVFRTDMQGDISCTSDGKTVSFEVSRNKDADVFSNAGSHSDKASNQTKPETKPTVNSGPQSSISYILNTNSKKFHFPDCGSVKKMKASNKKEYSGNREDLIAQGYSPCGNCHP